MKRGAVVHRGCPTEAENHYRCQARKKDGRLCSQPASAYDPSRGCYVCELHTQQLVLSLVTETTGVKP